MVLGEFLFASIVATALTFRKELSGQVYVPPDAILFPCGASEAQQALRVKMEQAFESGDYDISIRAAEDLMKPFPNCPWPLMYRGKCYIKLLRYEDAAADFEKALTTDGVTEAGTTYRLEHNRELLVRSIRLCKDEAIVRDRVLAEVRAAAADAAAKKETRSKSSTARPRTRNSKASAVAPKAGRTRADTGSAAPRTRRKNNE